MTKHCDLPKNTVGGDSRERARELGVVPSLALPPRVLQHRETGLAQPQNPRIPGAEPEPCRRLWVFPVQARRGGAGRDQRDFITSGVLNIHDQHILPQEETGTRQLRLSQHGDNKPRVLSLFPPSFHRDACAGERPALGFVSLSQPQWPRPHGRNPVPFRGDMRGRSQGSAGRAGKVAVLEPAAGAGTRRAGSSRSGSSRERRAPGSEPGRIPPGGDIAGMVTSVWRRERGDGSAGGEGDGDCSRKEGAGMAEMDTGKRQNPEPGATWSPEEHRTSSNTDPQALQTPKLQTPNSTDP